MLHHLRQLQRYSLVLAVLLFLAQLSSFLHAHDLEQHPDATPCQLCLHASNLDHALGGHVVAVLSPTFVNKIHSVALRFTYQSLSPVNYYSRAPPQQA